MVTCPYCGTAYDAPPKFCGNCGAGLSDLSSESPNPFEDPAAQASGGTALEEYNAPAPNTSAASDYMDQPQYGDSGYAGQQQYDNSGYAGQQQYDNSGYAGQQQYDNSGYAGQQQYDNSGYAGQQYGNSGYAGQAQYDHSSYADQGYGGTDYAEPGSFSYGEYSYEQPQMPTTSDNSVYTVPYTGGVITERSIPLAIILSLVTCGIYTFYWIYKLNEEINYLADEPESTTGGMVILFSIITCGIYEIYWGYRMGQRVDRIRDVAGSSHILYLILFLTSGVSYGITAFVALALMQNEINKLV